MELPERYFVGEEFVKDTNKIDASIYCHFRFLAPVSKEYFEINGSKVNVYYDISHLLTVKISREISSLLFESLKRDNGQLVHFIIGYVDEILPEVNELINRQKYCDGHLLNRMFSTLDIDGLFIEHDASHETIRLDWPQIIPAFPPSAELAGTENHVFIRDYIDAMTMYYTYDFDSCIRYLITSLENYFHFMHFEGKFKDKLNKCLSGANYISQWNQYLSILKKNIEFIYDIRNGIVHDKFRLLYSDKNVCKKGIGTLSYVYQSLLLEERTAKYIVSLALQFLSIEDVCCGFNLDSMALGDFDSEQNIITSTQEFDEFMFDDVRIDESTKNAIYVRLR